MTDWHQTTLPRSYLHHLQPQTPPANLGHRSKSQDVIRPSSIANSRKTVRFNEIENGERPKSSMASRGRSFFLLSMLQGDPSSSSGRAKSSKVTTFLHLSLLGRALQLCHDPSVTAFLSSAGCRKKVDRRRRRCFYHSIRVMLILSGI